MPLCVCGHAFVVVLASEVCGGAGVLACLFVGRMCVVLTYEAYSSSRVERGRLQPRPAPASTCQSSPLHASPRAEVQKRAAPVILDGDDCIIQSETGSGKTLAFLLPALSRLAYPPVVYPDDLKASARVALHGELLLHVGVGRCSCCGGYRAWPTPPLLYHDELKAAAAHFLHCKGQARGTAHPDSLLRGGCALQMMMLFGCAAAAAAAAGCLLFVELVVEVPPCLPVPACCRALSCWWLCLPASWGYRCVCGGGGGGGAAWEVVSTGSLSCWGAARVGGGSGRCQGPPPPPRSWSCSSTGCSAAA